jgi:hypothetical protein
MNAFGVCRRLLFLVALAVLPAAALADNSQTQTGGGSTAGMVRLLITNHADTVITVKQMAKDNGRDSGRDMIFKTAVLKMGETEIMPALNGSRAFIFSSSHGPIGTRAITGSVHHTVKGVDGHYTITTTAP